MATRFPPQTRRRAPRHGPTRRGVPPSQAASTLRRLSLWYPWGWREQRVAPPVCPRTERVWPAGGSTGWHPPASRVGGRPKWGTPRPNDPSCHTASRAALPGGSGVGRAHPCLGPGRPRPPRTGPEPLSGHRVEPPPVLAERRPSRPCVAGESPLRAPLAPWSAISVAHVGAAGFHPP